MKKYRFQVFIFWLLFTSGVISIYGVFYLASIGYFGEMPDFRQLENPKTNFASEIISSDNKVLGKYYFNDNRTPIEYEDINPEVIEEPEFIVRVPLSCPLILTGACPVLDNVEEFVIVKDVSSALYTC